MSAGDIVKWVIVLAAASLLVRLPVWVLAGIAGAALGFWLAAKACQGVRRWRNRRRIRHLLLSQEVTLGATAAELKRVGWTTAELARAFEKLGKAAVEDRRANVIRFDHARRIAERDRKRREAL